MNIETLATLKHINVRKEGSGKWSREIWPGDDDGTH